MTSGENTYLVLAHEDKEMVRRLVQRLSATGRVLVHVDAKTDISKWELDDFSCQFLDSRVPVYWGDWSLIEATTLMLERALNDPLTTRFTLVSGSHYPVISDREMTEFLGSGKNYIASRKAPNMPDGSRPEVEYQRRFYRTSRPNGRWSRLKNGVMNRVVYFGRPLDWKAVTPDTGMRAGEQFWSIDRGFAEYCVTQIRESGPLVNYFGEIVCPDEKIFATLYGMYADEYSPEGTTFSKWAGGANPVPLSQSDITQALERYPFWFARKFRSSDISLLDWLDAR